MEQQPLRECPPLFFHNFLLLVILLRRSRSGRNIPLKTCRVYDDDVRMSSIRDQFTPPLHVTRIDQLLSFRSLCLHFIRNKVTTTPRIHYCIYISNKDWHHII